jgi:hypothetical protein
LAVRGLLNCEMLRKRNPAALQQKPHCRDARFFDKAVNL